MNQQVAGQCGYAVRMVYSEKGKMFLRCSTNLVVIFISSPLSFPVLHRNLWAEHRRRSLCSDNVWLDFVRLDILRLIPTRKPHQLTY